MPKERQKILSKFPLFGMLQFSVDGEASGKPGHVGIGRVLGGEGWCQLLSIFIIGIEINIFSQN